MSCLPGLQGCLICKNTWRVVLQWSLHTHHGSGQPFCGHQLNVTRSSFPWHLFLEKSPSFDTSLSRHFLTLLSFCQLFSTLLKCSQLFSTLPDSSQLSSALPNEPRQSAQTTESDEWQVQEDLAFPAAGADANAEGAMSPASLVKAKGLGSCWFRVTLEVTWGVFSSEALRWIYGILRAMLHI